MGDAPPMLMKQWVAYDPNTGAFTHAVARSKIRVGEQAGTVNGRGYLAITHKDKRYLAHRLAWFFVYGVWPKEVIDHINGVKTDNRLCNLRLATKSQNGANRAYHPMRGIGYRQQARGDRWVVRFKKNRKAVYVGSFASLPEAQAAYRAAYIKHFGEFARFE